MTVNKDPKFYKANGDLTAYTFACGYIQYASIDGTEKEKWNNGKELFMYGNFQVKWYKNGTRVLWESFDTLAEARDTHNRIKINN